MILKKYSKFIYIILFIFSEVYCDEKSSLTFVIDVTNSMENNIYPILVCVDRVVSSVKNSRQSPFEEFVLITFDDTDSIADAYYSDEFAVNDVRLRIRTKDSQEFKKALFEINVSREEYNYCPDYSMSGIMKGIENSQPRSIIYVFTDATAKDYKKYEEVKNLALKKQTTVIFVLTGDCEWKQNTSEYTVYQDLADATGGKVINITKNDIDQIIPDLVLSVQGRISGPSTSLAPSIENTVTSQQPEIQGVKNHDIHCKVNSLYPMKIKWFYHKNKLPSEKLEIQTDSEHTISPDGRTLHIISTDLDLVGKYTCETFPLADENQNAPYLKAPIITLSKDSFTVMNGYAMSASCIANGIPEPIVTWQFKSVNSDTFANISNTGEQLSFANIDYKQAGSYKCTAQNEVGSDHRTINVVVNGEPIITNVDTVYTAVTGDRVLKIPCDVTGVPEPTITWKHEGEVVVSDGKLSVVNNALVINNPNENDSKKFTCEALNIYGYTNKSFDSVISDFINQDEYLNSFMYLKPGETANIECRLPVDVNPKSEVRWYVNGEKTNVAGLIYTIENVVFSNDGNYTCRWNTNDGSGSLNYVIDVGYKPTFLSTLAQTVEWDGDKDTVLDCNVNAKPSRTVNKWTKNGEQLDASEAELAITGWGTYVCDVSNPHGSVQHTFTVTTNGCLISRTVDRVQNTPLLVDEETSNWPLFDPSYNEFLTVSQGDVFSLECSTQDQTTNTFVTHPNAKRIKAECSKDDKFIVDGRIYKFEDLQCKEFVRSSQILKQPCMMNNGKMIEIGFKLMNVFLGVYDVCYSETYHRTLYTKVLMFKGNIGNIVGPSFKLEAEGKTGKNGATVTKCQYNQRWLVSPEHVEFGPAQAATLSDTYNTVPVYEPCEGSSRMSWSAIEDTVQYEAPNGLIVWTGASNYDSNGIPRYLWKVVKNKDTYEALVYVNVPSPKRSDIMCPKPTLQILKRITDQDDEFTYACSMEEFLNVFNLPISEFDFNSTS